MENDVCPTNKRSDVSKRKSENKNKSFHIVKMKLNRFSKNEPFKKLLIKNVINTNKIKSDAFHLINFHTLRCLENNLELPDYNDQNFYYKCMAYISKFESRKEKIDQNNELIKSLNLFMNHNKPAFKDYSGNLMNNASLEMKTVLINHIVLNFPNRLKRYCRLKYGLKDIWHSINNIYLDEGINYNVLTKEEEEIKNFIIYSPTEENIKKRLNHFLRLEYEIQKYFDTLEENTKGVRNFSITPTKGSFVHSYIKICSSCLSDILKSTKDDQFTKLGWRDLFNLNEVETCNKTFHNEILTDGYGVSITLEKSLNLDTFEVDDENKITCSCGCKVTKGGYKKHLESKSHIKKTRNNKTVDEINFDRYVGIDPGINQIYTGVDENNEFINCSSTEYRMKSKIIDNLEWNKRQLKENPEIQKVINNLKSFKTVNIEKYKEAFDTYNDNYDKMIDFYNGKPYKKWKFKTYCFSKKTISQMCKDITKNKKTLVGYGDWSKNQGIIKKHPSTPNKKLRDALIRYKNCKVVSVNEYRTSKECSLCKEAVYNLKDSKNKKCHQVVRCSNNECSMCWQRDKNASRNILMKLFKENLGLNSEKMIET